jgi:tetratricopeptide (TPR) repeat protein
VGAALLAGSRWVFSTETMWARSLDLDENDRRAVEALTGDRLRAGDYQGAVAALDRCVQVNPKACTCVAERASVRLHVPGALDQAVADARAALEKCPKDHRIRRTFVSALALRGDVAEAEKEARDALKESEADGRMHYELALVLDRQGRSLDALGEAERAVELAAGHDAELLLGAKVRAAGGLDGAEHAADPLTGDKSDAAVLYGRALIAEKLKDYDKARERYVAALHADPTFASARYNLAVLALHRGLLREAKSDVAKFATAFPDDPRNAELKHMIDSAAGPAPQR